MGRLTEKVQKVMLYTGMEFEQDAKGLRTYTDRTVNLRNSISSELKDIPYGYELLMKAGMSYAAAVESKGYDVITGPARKAVEKFKQRLKKTLRDEAS